MPQKDECKQKPIYQIDTLKTKMCQSNKSLKKAIILIGYYQFGLGFLGFDGLKDFSFEAFIFERVNAVNTVNT
jgi:hypothetical protein